MLCNTKIHKILKHVIERENGQTSSFKLMKLQKNVTKKDMKNDKLVLLTYKQIQPKHHSYAKRRTD